MGPWHALPQGPFFRSARLDCALARQMGALVSETENGRLLALPYDEQMPFPLPELFCLARVGEVGRQRCVIYRLDRRNSPVFWGK